MKQTGKRFTIETLKANNFTTRSKLKLVTNEQLEVMFSGTHKLGLGSMAVLKFKLDQLKEESPLPTGKVWRKENPETTVRIYIFSDKLLDFWNHLIHVACSRACFDDLAFLLNY